MRACLRLAYDRKSSKEIANLLIGPDGEPLTEGTVSKYIAEAVRLLGAANRRQASEMLHAYEAAAPQELHAYEAAAPQEVSPQPLGVDFPPLPDAPAVQPSSSPWWRSLLPFRSQGITNNDLTIRQRLVWVFLIAVALAVSLGAIANALRLINDIIIHRN